MKILSSRSPFALRSIALFELAKGSLAVAAAFGVLSLRHTDLHSALDAYLFHHGIDPESPYRRLFVASVAKATRLPIAQVVGFAMTYATIRFAEGFGLWYARPWAEWLAVISSGLYLPLELLHFVRRPTLLTAGVIILNIAIMAYLAKLLIHQRPRHLRPDQRSEPEVRTTRQQEQPSNRET